MIKTFNNRFKIFCNGLKTSQKKFVLGLSGGIDSMALLYLLQYFLENNKDLNIEVFPVIVDHGLRLNSSKEANAVCLAAKNLGFKAIVEKIHVNIPTGNIQNWARKERRRILCDVAFDLSANLLLAHHSDDQVETIFMRSIKGSGIDGLVGMQETILWNGILIIRPLIFFKKNQIIKYVKENNIKFFQDSSNFMYKFERVKVRQILSSIKFRNWPYISEDLTKFSLLNKKLLKRINNVFAKWVQKNILVDNRGAIRVDFKEFKKIFIKSNLFATNIMGKIIKTVGGKEFSPKRKKTLDCLRVIFNTPLKNRSLGNVNIILKDDYLFFIRENRNINFEMTIIKNKKYIFDGRFLLVSRYSGNLTKAESRYLDCKNDNSAFVEYKDIINKSIPSVSTLEGVTISPHFSNVDMKSERKKISEYKPFDLYLINRLLV